MGELLGDDARRRDYALHSREMCVERFDWDVLAARLSEELAPFDGFKADINRL
jgi:hypothetical protein